MKIAIKACLCIVLLCFAISCSTSDSHDFAATLGSKNFDESYGLALDKDSNIIITGVFSDTLFFSSTSYLVSKGGSDIFVAKYLKNGKLQWMKSIGESANDEAYNLAVNSADDIYVCGHIGGRPFVSKYNSKGINFWCSMLEGKGECNDVLWKDEVLYVLGTFTDTLNNVLRAKGSSDIFVLQLNEDGEIKESNAYGFEGEDVAKRMIFTSDSTIAFCGSITQNSAHQKDLALIEINTHLQLKRHSVFGSVGDDIALSLKAGDDGDLFLCGQFSGDSIYAADKVMKVNYYGEFDAFLCKLNSDLSPQFFYTAGSAENDWATDLALSHNNHLLCSIVLNKQATLHFNDAKKVNGFGNYDIVLASLNEQNQLEFVQSYGNNKENGVNKILLGEDDKLYATGWFEGAFYFGMKHHLKALKGGDAFVFKGDLNGFVNTIGR